MLLGKFVLKVLLSRSKGYSVRVPVTRIENSVNDGCGNWEALFVSPFTGMVKQESKWEYEYVPYLRVRSLGRTIRMHARGE